MSDDNFVTFLVKKKFDQDETGYFFRKVGTSWLNCDCGVDSYTSETYYQIIVTSSIGEDIFKKRYIYFDEFESIITKVIREERFKILLD